MELLEKFRSTQERARRAQRLNISSEGGLNTGFSELRIGDGTVEGKGKESARGPSQPLQKDTNAQPPVPPKKLGLGRQFGRLGGAVSGKNRRN